MTPNDLFAQHLGLLLDRSGARLGASAGPSSSPAVSAPNSGSGDIELGALRQRFDELGVVPPVDWLGRRFGVTQDTVDVVLGVLALQLRPRVRGQLAQAMGGATVVPGTEAGPSLSLVRAALGQSLVGPASWPGATPNDVLWKLGLVVPSVALGAAGDLMQVPVHVPGHWIASWCGERVLSSELWAVARRLECSFPLELCLVPDEWRETLAHTLAGFYRRGAPAPGAFWEPGGHGAGLGLPIVLSGAAGTGKSLLAKGLANRLERVLIEVDGAALAHSPRKAELLALLLTEAQLHGELVCVQTADALLGDGAAVASSFLRAVQERHVAVILETRRPSALDQRLRDAALLSYALKRPDKQTRTMLWQTQLPDDVLLDADVDPGKLAGRNLTGRQIRNAATLTHIATERDEASQMLVVGQQQLLMASELQVRSDAHDGAIGLHQGRAVGRDLSDLVLPGEVAAQIDEIVHAIQRRQTILNEWGLHTVFHRGIGVVCLFDGPSGVGKTHCAEWLAATTDLLLHRVRSSQVTSKYIGETEKRLEEIFEQIDPRRHLLLFDEADSFFSKRTSVSRATDRYSNMEINTLLQLIEAFSGVVVLTTNLKEQMDKAFERRITYHVNFPMPDADARLRIWRALLPATMPLDMDVDVDELAEDYPLSGGGIKNVILRAAYAGAKEGRVTQAHLAAKAREEAVAGGILIRNRDQDDGL